jgi:pimeloyl-[acyl-carrier protein] synthase
MSETSINPSGSADPIQFNPLQSDFIVDPHPQLHRLRAEDPVHWSAVLGVWVLTRYADVHAAMRDSRFSSDSSKWASFSKFFLRGATSPTPMSEMYSKWMLQMDPPDHTRLRALVNKSFTPRVVEAMHPTIQGMVDKLIDDVIAKGKMDVMSDLAFPLPILVICALLGVPAQDYEKIRVWTHELLPSMTPAISAAGMARINEVIVEYREYFRQLADQRRKEPRDDLLSALIAAREQDQKLSEEELLATCILLAFAGHATTAQLTGKAILTFLQNPDQMEKLRADPSLIGGAIEEACRYETPLQVLYRATMQDVEIGGKVIPKNQLVFLSLAAANRDPAQFDDPDRFDITRDASKHVAFAYGIHYCAGAPLARLEGQIAINTLLRRLKDIHVDVDGIRREPSLILRGLTALPVTFQPRGLG